ncbi:hypothetical protein M0P48_04595 [Candidatus Gracilibacteria bacterium]|jgi:hypothetical protein|nr:hypothetical protein [Candidatus Gracilibacteria bacterium]
MANPNLPNDDNSGVGNDRVGGVAGANIISAPDALGGESANVEVVAGHDKCGASIKGVREEEGGKVEDVLDGAEVDEDRMIMEEMAECVLSFARRDPRKGRFEEISDILKNGHGVVECFLALNALKRDGSEISCLLWQEDMYEKFTSPEIVGFEALSLLPIGTVLIYKDDWGVPHMGKVSFNESQTVRIDNVFEKEHGCGDSSCLFRENSYFNGKVVKDVPAGVKFSYEK